MINNSVEVAARLAQACPPRLEQFHLYHPFPTSNHNPQGVTVDTLTNAYIIWWRILGQAKRRSRETNPPQQMK